MENSHQTQFKVKLEDVDLPTFREYMLLEGRLQDLGEETTYLEIDLTETFGVERIKDIEPDMVEEDPEEFQRIIDGFSELTMRRYEIALEQLKAIAPDDIARRKLDKLSVEEVSHEKQDLQLEGLETLSPHATFTLPGCNDQQIADLQEELASLSPEHEAHEIYLLTNRIDKLKKHELILLDVSEAAFAAFIRASTIEQSNPQKDEDAYLAVGDENIKEYFEHRKANLSSFTTVKQRRDKMERDRMIRRYVKSSDKEFWNELHNILTLFLTPLDEPFSVRYSKIRAEYIEKMKMNQLYPLLTFIEAVLISYGANTAMSGPIALASPKIEYSMKSLQSNALTFLENGGGLSL